MRWAVLMVVFAGAVAAQRVAVSPADAQERETIAKLLASEKDPDKAWAAVLTAKYKQPSFVPAILELLTAANLYVRLAALDALIAMEVDPMPEVMTALLDAHPEHFEAVLILMGRLPYRNREFLESLLTRRTFLNHQWAALNAVLAQSRGAVQTKHLWDQWQLELELVVADPIGKPRPTGAHTMCLDAIAFGPRDSFPTYSYQRLLEVESNFPREKFVDGPHPHIRGNSMSTSDGCYVVFPRQRYVRDYLEHIAGSGPKLPETVTTWRSTARFRTDAKALLTKLRAYVTDLRTRLVAEGLLSPDAPLPPLRVTVSDQRGNKRTPLPEFDWSF